VQTETVRLHFDVSANFKSFKLTLIRGPPDVILAG
jgi:hypothetical protein